MVPWWILHLRTVKEPFNKYLLRVRVSSTWVVWISHYFDSSIYHGHQLKAFSNYFCFFCELKITGLTKSPGAVQQQPFRSLSLNVDKINCFYLYTLTMRMTLKIIVSRLKQYLAGLSVGLRVGGSIQKIGGYFHFIPPISHSELTYQHSE